MSISILSCRHSDASQTQFKTLGPIKGLMPLVIQRPIKVQIKGIAKLFGVKDKTRPGYEIVQDWVTQSISTWLTPLQDLSARVIVEIELVDHGADLIIDFKEEMGRAHYNPLFSDTIHFEGPHFYSILVHEVGHAFGLGDTYEGGFGLGEGAMSTHPISVMGSNAISKLREDDIQGIKYVFCTVHDDICDAKQYKYKHVSPEKRKKDKVFRDIVHWQEQVLRGELTIEDYEDLFKARRQLISDHWAEDLEPFEEFIHTFKGY